MWEKPHNIRIKSDKKRDEKENERLKKCEKYFSLCGKEINGPKELERIDNEYRKNIGLQIKNDYLIKWEDFINFDGCEPNHSLLKYIIIKVPPEGVLN